MFSEKRVYIVYFLSILLACGETGQDIQQNISNIENPGYPKIVNPSESKQNESTQHRYPKFM